MLIHNATFMVEYDKGAEFLKWFVPLAHKAGGESGHVSVLREAHGVPSGESHPLSVAFQVAFDNKDQVEAWRAKRLRPLVKAFERRYAPHGMVFTSVFESIF